MKALNTVPFVSVENMMRLVLELGVETCIEQIAEYIEADFAKWEQFDKCPRIGSHSDVGVIELMPTSDGGAACSQGAAQVASPSGPVNPVTEPSPQSTLKL